MTITPLAGYAQYDQVYEALRQTLRSEQVTAEALAGSERVSKAEVEHDAASSVDPARGTIIDILA